MFQSFNLISELSVFENVELPLTYGPLGAAERKERVLAALERVGMTHRARHLPSQLSGGQQQRVAVARAVVGDPKLVLADEPTGNLDSNNGEAVMDLLRELNEGGATVIVVTHDPRYARHAARSISLFDGRVVDEELARLVSARHRGPAADLAPRSSKTSTIPGGERPRRLRSADPGAGQLGNVTDADGLGTWWCRRRSGGICSTRSSGEARSGRSTRVGDPRLDRAVAIKILRSELGEEAARVRHLREGQAMAQVANPHVVQIYDVGIVEETGQVYLAMELIEGTTLRKWLGAQPRSVEEILVVLEGAAQGLAAAHAAEIVHRDFKPGERARDGRWRGEGRRLRAGPRRGRKRERERDHAVGRGLPAGRDGDRDVDGNAPLHAAGGDPRQRVVARGGSVLVLRDAARGAVRKATVRGADVRAARRPTSARTRRSDRPDVVVPAEVLLALDRGLEPEPERRFATMLDLVAALRRRHRTRRPVIAVGVVGTAVPRSVRGRGAVGEPGVRRLRGGG